MSLLGCRQVSDRHNARMTTRQSIAAEATARRCLEILDQMTGQLAACHRDLASDPARLQRLRDDLTKVVHWALLDRGTPDLVARIRDCYRRCDIDLDDATVLRQVRGTIKGELRKSGIDASVPDLDPALDPPTIILTTKRTIQRLRTPAGMSAPGPALDRKPSKPPTARARRPTTRVHAPGATEMKQAFERVTARTLEQIRAGGRTLARSDCLAAVYNDAAWKARFLAQVVAELPGVDTKVLGQTLDVCFREAFKGDYIERTDRHGHRSAHRR